MRNRDDKEMSNIDRNAGSDRGSDRSSDRSSGSEVNETSRRPGSSYDSSTGRSGSSGNKNIGSDRLRDEDESKQSDDSGSIGTPKDRHF